MDPDGYNICCTHSRHLHCRIRKLQITMHVDQKLSHVHHPDYCRPSRNTLLSKLCFCLHCKNMKGNAHIFCQRIRLGLSRFIKITVILFITVVWSEKPHRGEKATLHHILSALLLHTLWWHQFSFLSEYIELCGNGSQAVNLFFSCYCAKDPGTDSTLDGLWQAV